MIQKLLEYFGLFSPEFNSQDACSTSYTFSDELYEEHLKYLKEIFQYEESRQIAIENKLSLLIGQTGIVFSLISLFVPLYFDQFWTAETGLKIFLAVPFLLGLAMFLLSIHHSTKTLDVEQYAYASASPTTVLKDHKDIKEFKREEVRDLLISIDKNTAFNMEKAKRLIFAQRFFRLGLFFIAMLAVILCCVIFLMNENPKDLNGISINIINYK